MLSTMLKAPSSNEGGISLSKSSTQFEEEKLSRINIPWHCIFEIMYLPSMFGKQLPFVTFIVNGPGRTYI